jgi:putative ABC transport system substrate-binding protein
LSSTGNFHETAQFHRSAGLVAILARPGDNITGLSVQVADLAGKRLEILREVLPGLRRVGVMANAGNPLSVGELGEVQGAAARAAP